MRVLSSGEKIPGNEGFDAIRLIEEEGTSFIKMSMSVGGKVEEHSSKAHLFVYVMEGRLLYRSGKSEKVCPKGSLITDEPGNIHSFENDDTKNTELLIIKIEK